VLGIRVAHYIGSAQPPAKHIEEQIKGRRIIVGPSYRLALIIPEYVHINPM
jgi:hypothetical protein